MMKLSFHGNIVQFYGACCWRQNSTDVGGTPMLVLEYMEVGSLCWCNACAGQSLIMAVRALAEYPALAEAA